MKPRLTIGIPTRNRPEMFQRSISSAIDQTVAAKIIVNDSSTRVSAREQTKQICNNSNAIYVQRDGGTLWENWKYLALQADTEFFMWLQDDDVICRHLAERIVGAFDRFPDALVYLAPLHHSVDGKTGSAHYATWGPKLMLDFLEMTPSEFDGKILTSMGYMGSWATAPGKAFRVGGPFRFMLESLPGDCDMFTERLDIAVMGLHGNAIADPNCAGLTIHHGENETVLRCDDELRQREVAYRFLDILASTFRWKDPMIEWMQTTPFIRSCLSLFHSQCVKGQHASKNAKDLAIMLDQILMDNPE